MFYQLVFPLRVAERLKTEDLRELGNMRKVSKRHRMIAQCPAPPALPAVPHFKCKLELVSNIL